MDQPNQTERHTWSASAIDVRFFRTYQSCKDGLDELVNAAKGDHAPLSSITAASRSALEKKRPMSQA